MKLSVKQSLHRRFTTGQFIAAVAALFLGITAIAYAAITLPNTFTAGTPISAAQVNANFSTLTNAMSAISQTTLQGSVSVPQFPPVNVQTITFTAPANGFVELTGGGFIAIIQLQTGEAGVTVNLTSTSGGVTDFDKTLSTIDTRGGSTPHHSYAPFSLSRTIPVTAGTSYTYYLTAFKDVTDTSATSSVGLPTLTARFYASQL